MQIPIFRFLIPMAFLAQIGVAQAAGIENIVVPDATGDGFSIDHEALDADTTMTPQEKELVLRALNASPNIRTQEMISIPGLKADCTIHTTFHVIPTGAGCKVTVGATGAKVLDALPSSLLTNAICAVVTAETDDVLEPVCSALLSAVVSTVIKPALDGCVKKQEGVEIGLDFNLVPPKLDPTASCS